MSVITKDTDFSKRMYRENQSAISSIEETINRSRQVVQQSKDLILKNAHNHNFEFPNSQTVKLESISSLDKPFISSRRSLQSTITDTEPINNHYYQEAKNYDSSALDNRKLKFEIKSIEEELSQERRNCKILREANDSQARLYIKKIEELENENKRLRHDLVLKDNQENYFENVLKTMKDEINQLHREKEMMMDIQEKSKNEAMEECASLNALYESTKNREEQLKLQIQEVTSNANSTRYELEDELSRASRKIQDVRSEYERKINYLSEELDNEKKSNLSRKRSQDEMMEMEMKIRELEDLLLEKNKLNEELKNMIEANQNHEKNQSKRILELEEQLVHHSKRYNELKERIERTEATASRENNISPINFATEESARSPKNRVKSPRMDSKIGKGNKKKVQKTGTCEVCKKAGISSKPGPRAKS